MSGARVVVLVPGMNGDGRSLLEGAWADFADRVGVVVLAPTFRVTEEEVRAGRGYYYPEQGSGEVLVEALEELKQRTGADVERVYLVGFSAGAHFAHRFALWRPERVAAFAAYAAAWWDEPTVALVGVPALILCGEADPRHEATLAFVERGLALDLPWVWRSYAGTGHEMTPTVQRMMAVFLSHYLRDEKDEPWAGDVQTYEILPWAERDAIAEAARVRLPSRAVAETWKLEK